MAIARPPRSSILSAHRRGLLVLGAAFATLLLVVAPVWAIGSLPPWERTVGEPVFVSCVDPGSGPSAIAGRARWFSGETIPVCVPTASIQIVMFTNGEDANEPPGPIISVGDPVTWTYTVKNTGQATLDGIVVTDDHGVTVSCPATTLASHAMMTCSALGTAVVGQYVAVATVVGSSDSRTVSDSDPSTYYGVVAKASLTVTKRVAWNGVTPVGGTAFQICISGPSYAIPDCKTFTYPDGLVQVWGGLAPGSYSIAERDPGALWSVTVSGSPVSVTTGQSAAAMVINSRKLGSLVVSKRVDWNGVTPVDGTVFQVCAAGPSYATPQCKAFTYPRDLEQSWTNLIPGVYSVTEPDPGAQWIVSGSGSPALVPEDGGLATAVVSNTRRLGSLLVTKTVNWNGMTPVDGTAFQICIVGPSYATPNCKTFTYPSDLVKVWNTLIPGAYTITEVNPGPLWSVAVSGSPAGVPSNGGQATAGVTNARLRSSITACKEEYGTGARLAGWTIAYSGPESGSAVTGDGSQGTTLGCVTFAVPQPGTYTLSELAQDGWTLTSPPGNAYVVDVPLGASASGPHVFTNYRWAEVRACKTDHSGVPLPGWTMRLYDAAGLAIAEGQTALNQTQTEACSAFVIAAPGTYEVREVLQDGWVRISPSSGGFSFVATSGYRGTFTFANGRLAIGLDKQIKAYEDGAWQDNLAEVVVGAPVYYRYVVTNTGSARLTIADVSDDLLGTIPCGGAVLEPGASVVCGPVGPYPAQFTGVNAQIPNTATVQGCSGDTCVSAGDSAAYVGLYWAFTSSFWRDHTVDPTDAWKYTAYETSDLLGAIFDPTCLADYPLGSRDTFAETPLSTALGFRGGVDLIGAKELLLRAAVAGLLNASYHETLHGGVTGPNGEVYYPMTSAGVIGETNAVLCTDRVTILTLAYRLDLYNNGIDDIAW